MTMEDRLREALAAKARAVDPAPDAWARVQARIRRRQRRRVVVPALAAAAAVGAVLIAAAVLPDATQQVVTRPPATADPLPGTAGDDATGAPASAPLPDVFLAVRDHGTKLVVAETATGTVLRVLVDLGPYRAADEHDPIGSSYVDGVALSPDGRTVYYSTGPEPASGRLYRVSAGGGEPQYLGDGLGPVVSPDGRYLAYVLGPYVAVRDLTHGEQRLWADEDAVLYPSRPTWAADSRHLAFEASSAGAGEPGDVTVIRVLDTSEPGTLADSRVVAAEPGRNLLSPSYRSFDGLLGVVEAPSGSGREWGAAHVPVGGEHFSVRDPSTGAVKGRIGLSFRASSAVYDRSGRHQLFVASDGSVHRRSGGPFTGVGGLSSVSLIAW